MAASLRMLIDAISGIFLMCGLVGLAKFPPDSSGQEQVVRKMIRALKHRGPDADGTWVNHSLGVELGHTRLSVVDLSSAGAQPMISQDGRFVLVFNGEIYNHMDLRKEFEGGVAWKGRSDTETLLRCLSTWGLDKTVERLVGMFAFAMLDRAENTITLARDRVGEKPLYYGWLNGPGRSTFVFSSELHALKIHPDFSGHIDKEAVAQYLKYQYVPAPYSIYKGIKKLTPGSLLTLDLKNGQESLTSFWGWEKIFSEGQKNRFTGTFQEATYEVEALLKDSVKSQMLADVPVGTFLSGGIDSSTITSLMQEHSISPVNTFSIGFSDSEFNEAESAKKIADWLGTNHTELYLSEREVINLIPNLPDVYTEPFADSSQIPTCLVAQLAKKHVTVALTGDGGDEIFGGYNRYIFTKNYWNLVQSIPKPLKSGLGQFIRMISTPYGSSVLKGLLQIGPKKYRYSDISNKLSKTSSLLAANSLRDIYDSFTQTINPDALLLSSFLKQDICHTQDNKNAINSVEEMILRDSQEYLPDDILVKVDRATMYYSLEGRMPFLDKRLIELSWALPTSYKMSANNGKRILRNILFSRVPEKLFTQPKSGFAIPIDSWLRGGLKDWADSLLVKNRIDESGVFESFVVRKTWEEHLSKKRNWGRPLWSILMFLAWLSSHDGRHYE